MINKRGIIFGMFILLTIILMGILNAQGSYCCERTNNGIWCMNAEESTCDEDYRSAPTSCESTSYCKLGTCINSREGDCIERTPQQVCLEENGGIWKPESIEEIPQCQLGCCLIGNQAAFVTQTRCSRLSSIYGLDINYRTDISNEATCAASATSGIEGVCVFEREYVRTCKRMTQEECDNIEASSEEGTVSFHPGYLCSAEELGVDCGPSERTTCVEGRDEVFFVDTCGNIANVYDASRTFERDSLYWKYIAGYGEVTVDCGSGSNAGSTNCGNCDYYAGSTCKKAERGENPIYGENICRDLGCEYEGENYQHGETWCGYQGVGGVSVDEMGFLNSEDEDEIGNHLSKVGGRYFRLVCYNGEVTVEPCADFKQEICVESTVGESGFKAAACVVNKWQDCYSQNSSEDCDLSRRDCKWIETKRISYEEETSRAGKIFGFFGFGKKDVSDSKIDGVCVPKFSPGINFWESEGGDTESLCSLGTRQCVVTRIIRLGDRDENLNMRTPTGGKEDTYYGECVHQSSGNLKDDWVSEMDAICQSFGDCGGKVNILDIKGSQKDNPITQTDYAYAEGGGGGGGLF